MKLPYFKVTAVCRNEDCAMTNWSVDRKHRPKTDTGRPGYFNALVCPTCKMWGDVTQIQEVT